MAGLNETPGANRIRIAFFGLRNAGKSTLVNAFTGQSIAIVSEVAGTTTDPVSKAMEILPLGPCLVTDTAGLDDEGELGQMRVERTLRVLETTDIAVWVSASEDANHPARALFSKTCRRLNVKEVAFVRGETVESLKARIAALGPFDVEPKLLEGFVQRGDRILCVCPIDESAPKGRLILPQVQVLRACLDLGAVATVCQPSDLSRLFLSSAAPNSAFDLVITDSQAFREVAAAIPLEQRLTSFSILFARQKGDWDAYREGLARLRDLKDGDTVLMAEGCTHHRQCNDIGTVKLPKALMRLSGKTLNFEFVSGASFEDVSPDRIALVVQCGGCMLTRREVCRRIAAARAAGVPIVNYGMVLALAAGVDLSRCVEPEGVGK